LLYNPCLLIQRFLTKSFAAKYQAFEALEKKYDEYDVRGRRWMDCIVRLGTGERLGERESTWELALRGTPELARKLAVLENGACWATPT
jgi:hypothetical protein